MLNEVRGRIVCHNVFFSELILNREQPLHRIPTKLVHQAPRFETFGKGAQLTLARAGARSLLVVRAWVTHRLHRVDSYPGPMQRVVNPAAGDMLALHVHIRPNETTHLLTTSPHTYMPMQPLNTHTPTVRS